VRIFSGTQGLADGTPISGSAVKDYREPGIPEIFLPQGKKMFF